MATEEEAKVAAYPFTTIDPNYGTGHSAYPCPCADVGFEACPIQEKRIPVQVKDVAGLVPGAYQVCALPSPLGARTP